MPVQGLFVLLQNPARPINRIWCALSTSVGMWSLGYALTISSAAYATSLRWARFSEANACLIPTIFLHFVHILTPRTVSQTVIKIRYVIAILLAFLTLFTPFIVETVKPILSFPYFCHFGPFAWFYVLFFFSNVILAQVHLWGSLGASQGTERNRLLYVFIAGILGFGTAIPGFFLSFDIPVHSTGNFVFLYAIPIAYAILKYQLMDIRVVIRKTVVYSILVVATTLIYLVIVLTTERFFQTALGYHSLPISMLAAAIIALIFQPLRGRVQALVDHRLFKGSVPQLAEQAEHLQQALVRTDQLRAVGTFAAGMAHEIKNPLATIKTFLEHLPARYDDPDFRTTCSRLVTQEIDKIDRLVKEVLEFARPTPPHLQDVMLTRLCDEVLALLQPKLVTQRIAVQRRYADTGACRADPIQLKQALFNLLLNSLEAMPSGGTLTVGVTPQDGAMAVTIQDTGPGIPPEVMKRLAEPFVTSKPHGTGLGLAIVQTIVQAHGGRVVFQSQEPIGTTVTIHLPAQTNLAPTAAPSSGAIADQPAKVLP